MIFDADVHLSLTEPNGQTAEELLRQMDACGVDKSMVWLMPPYFRHIDNANQYVYESAKAHPDRLTPFGWVDPHVGLEEGLKTVRRCLEDYCMPGVKLNGAQNAFYIDDTDLVDPLIGEIERHGAALALHIGADFYEFTHPYRAAKIAARHPKLRILMVHMGGAGAKPDLANPCIEFAARHHNMLLVGSAIPYKQALKAIKTLGAHRVCFGSDSPFAIQKVEVAAYKALLQDTVTDTERALVMGENIKSFLEKTGEWA